MDPDAAQAPQGHLVGSVIRSLWTRCTLCRRKRWQMAFPEANLNLAQRGSASRGKVFRKAPAARAHGTASGDCCLGRRACGRIGYEALVVVFLHDESEGTLELEAGCTYEIVDVGHVVVRKTAGT
jgi:hypothetical protein